MIAFEFDLFPPEAIPPWGDAAKGEEHLSWYGLSYGCYRLRAGSAHLLDYADQPLLEVSRTDLPAGKRAWVDYQIARFWDDILTTLPFVMEPAPSEVRSVLETCDRAEIASFARSIDQWLDEPQSDKAESDRRYELAGLARDWIAALSLDTAYLRPRAAIWLWSTNKQVTIAWDNRGLEFEGRPAWSAQRGFHTVDRREFHAAVAAFSQRFLAEMEQRTEAICRHWDRPDVAIDTDLLAEEQRHRAEWAQQMLSPPPALKPDWDCIAAAIREIRPS